MRNYFSLKYFFNDFRLKTFFLSMILALGAILLFYLWSNQTIPLGKEEALLNKKHFIANLAFNGKIDSPTENDFVFINIGYDIELVSLRDSYFPVGNIDITDREKLYNIVKILRKADTHKYLLIDVGLNRKYETGFDSLLISEIKKTKRIILPYLNENSLLSISDSITASAEYKAITFSGQFNKYTLCKDEAKSIPLKMWCDIDSGTYVNKWFLYFSNGHLSFNSIIPKIYIPPFSSKIDSNGNFKYYDLGVDLLEEKSSESISALVKNKIIVIGDFTRLDKHSSFVGNMPGSLILVNTYLNLKNQINRFPFSLFLTLFLTFSLFTYVLLRYEITEDCVKAYKKKKGFSHWIIAGFLNFAQVYLFSIGALIIMLNVIILFFYHRDISILILTSYFTMIVFAKKNLLIQKNRQHEKTNNANNDNAVLS